MGFEWVFLIEERSKQMWNKFMGDNGCALMINPINNMQLILIIIILELLINGTNANSVYQCPQEKLIRKNPLQSFL